MSATSRVLTGLACRRRRSALLLAWFDPALARARRRHRATVRQALAQRAADDRRAAGAGAGDRRRQHAPAMPPLPAASRARAIVVFLRGAARRARRSPRSWRRWCCRWCRAIRRSTRPCTRRRHRGAAGADRLGRCADRDDPEQRDRRGRAERDAAAGGVRAVLRLRADPASKPSSARRWWTSSRRSPTR